MLEVAVLMLIVTESQALSRTKSAMQFNSETIEQAPFLSDTRTSRGERSAEWSSG
jgi:hypothetical protein